MHHRETIQIETRGRSTLEITDRIAGVVRASPICDGLVTVFVHHTSASVILSENADPDVRRDLEAFLARLAPDGDPLFVHDAEGPDDMPAHIRTVLTQSSLTIPLAGGRLDLGTWQGVYLYEHRTKGHRRRVSVTLVGD